MGGRIVISQIAVLAGRDYLAILNDDRANRNFTRILRRPGFAQRMLHPDLVLGWHSCGL
jgi:hypothetical protein